MSYIVYKLCTYNKHNSVRLLVHKATRGNLLTRKRLQIDRLRAAREANGFESWQRLAAEAGVSHPTLSRLLSGRVKAVNAATLMRLAHALKVPPEWLTGDRMDLPFVPQWGPLGEGEGRSLWEHPTPALVRDSWFMQRVEVAIRRDLAEWYKGKALDAYESWGHALSAVFYEFSSSIVWRFACLSTGSGGGHALVESDDLPTISWLTYVLEPWLQGKAYLNAGAMRGIFMALLANPSRLWGSEIRDKDTLRALEQYEVICWKAESERLAETLGPPDE